MNFLSKKALSAIAMTLMTCAVVFSQEKVTDEELKQFAGVMPEVQQISMEAQGQVQQLAEAFDMDMFRFAMLYEAADNPDVEMPELSEEEQKKFEQMSARMDAIQPVYEKQFDDAVAKSGLNSDRFEEIATALQTDPALQQRLEAAMSE